MESEIFKVDFSKDTQISNLMRVRPVAAELFHVGGRTNMTWWIY